MRPAAAVKTILDAHGEITSLVRVLGTTTKYELIEATASSPRDDSLSSGVVKIKQAANQIATKGKRLNRLIFKLRSSLDGSRAKVAVDDMMMDTWSGLRRWLHLPLKPVLDTTLTKLGLASRAVCDRLASLGDPVLAISQDSLYFTMTLTRENVAFQNQILLLSARVYAAMMYDAFRTTNNMRILVPRPNKELTVYSYSPHVTHLPQFPREFDSHCDLSLGCAQLVLIRTVRNHVHVGLGNKKKLGSLPVVDIYRHVVLVVKIVELLRQTFKCGIGDHLREGLGISVSCAK